MLPHRLGGGGWLRCPRCPTAAPVRPGYGGASVERHRPGAGRPHRSTPGCPSRPGTPATVVLLVLDGLGWELLREHAADLPELSGLAGGAITTVAPSTTASALTSITTGLPPDPARGARVSHARRRRGAQRPAVDRRRGPTTGSLPRAAPHAVPRPLGAGRDPRASSGLGVHGRASAGRAVPRLEHDGDARRACRDPRRGRASDRLRLLPGRRHRRPRVRAARQVPRRRARVRRRARRPTPRRVAAGGDGARDRGSRGGHVGDDWFDLTPARRARAGLQRRGPLPLAVGRAGAARTSSRRSATGRVRSPGVGHDPRRAASTPAGSGPARSRRCTSAASATWP